MLEAVMILPSRVSGIFHTTASVHQTGCEGRGKHSSTVAESHDMISAAQLKDFEFEDIANTVNAFIPRHAIPNPRIGIKFIVEMRCQRIEYAIP
eukprot:4728594-Karenia_brevis.AAC.1